MSNELIAANDRRRTVRETAVRMISKRPRVFSLLIGGCVSSVPLALGLLPLFRGESLQPKEQGYLVIGLVCLWLSGVISRLAYETSLVEHLDRHLDVMTATRRQQDRKAIDLHKGIEIAGIRVDEAADDWYVEVMQRLLQALREVNERNVQARPFAERIVESAVAKARKSIEEIQTIHYPSHRERRRIRRLCDAIRHSRKYVYAVSYDNDPHFELCWEVSGSHFGGRELGYLEENQAAAARGVKVVRIFVLSDEAIHDRNSRKHKFIKNLVRAHRRFEGDGSEVFVMRKAEVPDDLVKDARSSMLCDDVFASESYHGTEIDGYIELNGPSIDRLEALHMQLRMIAKEKDLTSVLLGKGVGS